MNSHIENNMFFCIFLLFLFSNVLYTTVSAEQLTARYCYSNSESGDNAKKEAIRKAIESSNVFVSSISTVKNGIYQSEIIDLISCAYLTDVQISKLSEKNNKKCYLMKANISNKYDHSELLSFVNTKLEADIKSLIENCIKKLLPNYISEKEMNYLSNSKYYSKNVDIEQIIQDLLKRKDFIEKLNSMKGYSVKTDKLIDDIYYKDTIWGFSTGEFNFKDNNILIESCIQSFFTYLDEKLTPVLIGKTIEILVVGFADEVPVNSNGLPFNFKPIPYIPDFEGCPNMLVNVPNKYPAQPIFLLPNNSYQWVRIGKKGEMLKKNLIVARVIDNCQLSFSRGHFVLKYLKQFTKLIKNINIDYSYSGKGVDYNNITNNKKRKVIITLRQSRLH